MSLKLKGDDIDLKLLRACRGELELWAPAGRTTLPVDAATLERAFLRPAGLGVSAGAGAVGRGRLLEIAGAAAGVRLVEVAKRRTRRRLDGARAELATVRALGRELVSIAVEDEDPAAVEAARALLGLSGQPNVSYPRLLVGMAFDAP